MRRMPLGGLLAAMLVFAPLGCGTGPAARPLSQPQPTSAEDTARAAAESARENDEGLIYASSEDPFSEATLQLNGDIRGGEQVGEDTSVAELRLSFDALGGLLIEGEPVEMGSEAPADEEGAEAPSAEEASSPVADSLDALTLALSNAIETLEPAERLRIIIEPPEVPQRMDELFAAIGTIVANPPVPVEIHIVPAR